MTPQERQQFLHMQRQIEDLTEWMNARKRQQLVYPIDTVSMKALNEAFISTVFTRINVFDIYFQVTTTSPTERGQMRYFDDLTNQNFRMCTSKNPPDAANFTGTVDLTAV